MVLAYPSGRLGRGERAFVAVTYGVCLVFPLAELTVAPAADLFGCPPSACPSVPPLVRADAALFTRLQSVNQAGLLVLAAVFLGLVIRRVVTASPRGRRQLIPVAAAAAAGTVIFAAEAFLPADVGGAWNVTDIADHARTLGVAVAFLAGFYSSRLERSHVADLLARLAGARPPQIEPLLATVLRDPDLRLGIWDTGRAVYLDHAGNELPQPGGSGPRAATAVHGEDGPLGLLVHDQSVADDPKLFTSVVAAARLALENAALQARVDRQVAEIRASRSRILRAGDEQRRKLERDLHDGAQQRLLGLGLALELAHHEVPDGTPAAGLLDEASAELEAAICELRELARGICPPALTDYGLSVALRSLAGRFPVPVHFTDLPAGRLPTPIEATAYFVVSEALQNIAKHARASKACVAVRSMSSAVTVEVSDDGAGGADVTAGSGLRGLRDRIEAIDGSLAVDSRPGKGTRITAELPCGW